MYNLGEFQKLIIKRFKNNGAYIGLKDVKNEKLDILLPKKEVLETDKVDDEIEAFVYKDNQARFVATRKSPKISLGKLETLEVMDISKIGAFLDWGLEKELFLPFKEQSMKLEKGRKYLVALYIDKSERLCATMKIRDYLTSDSPYKEGEWVEGIIYSIHKDYGAFVAVDKKYDAMIENKDIVGVLEIGEPINFRISKVKKDGRLNLVLKNLSHIEINDNAEILFNIIKDRGGFLDLNDKSDPDRIKEICGMSKSSFKKAVGRLLKNQKIQFEGNGIKLI
ncbi:MULTISPECIES: S1 RNA-binding domain-containing protein [unclassified Parvimonas]|uniref:CvfB family protein n=1 Tax=unclassified Parvimonas TaxID=1151464 RepID=UPI002B476878|nr:MULTISPECIES: S1-like domain-containing RNA-binding protein [unclassified Parvimonas]MEB3024371.1 S1-like domain-containing RNA-binding protein [Parvimonas sp. M13]MEB3088517.1 S1-like domain-containing RNA-binding protein [Parvimonas sp. M20]